MDVSSGRKRSRAHSTATDELQPHPEVFLQWRLPVWVFWSSPCFVKLKDFCLLSELSSASTFFMSIKEELVLQRSTGTSDLDQLSLGKWGKQLAPNLHDRVEFRTLRDPVCHFQCSSRFPLLQVGRRTFNLLFKSTKKLLKSQIYYMLKYFGPCCIPLQHKMLMNYKPAPGHTLMFASLVI